jgi:myosin heavy subunit
MAEIEGDRIELIERQIAEKVTERVRSALFRLYATVGAAVVAVLGFVSWDIVSDIKAEIKAEIKSEITDSIADEIASKRAEIGERVTETRYMAKRASDVIQRVEKQLDDFQPQADNLDETIERVKSLNITAQDLIASYSREVQPLISNVDSISIQLRILAEQVSQLNTIAAAGKLVSKEETPQTSEQRATAIKTVISDTKDAEQRLDEARSKATVFFQFAGGRREQAEALSASLKAKGFIVPGEDREGGAAGKHEVRYFHNQDKEAAERLANDTTAALRTLGYPERDALTVVAESFVSYTGKKPRPGVVELWLEIPPR